MKRLPLALPLLAVALVGCGSSSSSSAPSGGSSGSSSSAATSASGSSSSGSGSSSSSSGATTQVIMKSLAFTPAALHIKVGQTVKWTNQDSPPHNVTYQSGPKFTSSPQVMNPGATYSVTFKTAGTITYFCSIHPFMKGTIIVGG